MVDILQSSLLKSAGFAHGFSLRTGGVSSPPFDSLNLGRGLGDDPGSVKENLRRFKEAIGAQRLFEVSQVHGTRVHTVEAPLDVMRVRKESADALIGRTAYTAVAVRVADCVPILLADPITGHVAAVHAGWRGAVKGIVQKVAKELCERAQSKPESLLAAVGPHIRVRSFEIGEEVAAEIEKAGRAVGLDVGLVDRSGAKPHGDLSRLVRAQLQSVGVPEDAIDEIPGDTFSEPERFFSYRREANATGRHIAGICVRDAESSGISGTGATPSFP